MTEEEFETLEVGVRFIVHNNDSRSFVCEVLRNNKFKIVQAFWKHNSDKSYNSCYICDDRKTELLPLYSSPLYLAMNEKE